MSESDAPLVLSTKEDMRSWSREQRKAGRTVAFVPTMGGLHEGHLSLVRRACDLGDVVVVSIYVNPSQFAPSEDFGAYPRDLGSDLAKLAALGPKVRAVFAPADLYGEPRGAGEPSPSGADSLAGGAQETWVRVTRLERPLCGTSRPHFFRGVCTVVTKLLHVVDPDTLILGQKDYQQLMVLRRMVRELDFACAVVAVETSREDDGLARSSRNELLSSEQRGSAAGIFRALQSAREAWEGRRREMQGEGEQEVIVSEEECFVAEVLMGVREGIEAAGGRVDYVQAVDAETLEQVECFVGNKSGAVIAVAAHFGDVRLIDNVILEPT